MKLWRWALLIFELALLAAILVLPQVDLPDFAFHGGTSPVAVKARLSAAAAPFVAARPARLWLPESAFESQAPTRRMAALTNSDSRLSFLCTLIC